MNKQVALLLVLRNLYNNSAPEEVSYFITLYRYGVITSKDDFQKLHLILKRIPRSVYDEIQNVINSIYG